MRIEVVAEQLRQGVPGGIGTYAAGLIGGLVALSDPSLEIALRASSGPSPDPLSAFGVEVVTTSLGHRLQLAAWDHGLGAVAGGDVLHLTSLAGPLVRGDRPVRTVMVHDVAWRHAPSLTTSRGRRWHEAALGRVLSSSAEIIVPSAPVAGDLEASGVPSSRLHVIGEGADHLPTPDVVAANEIRAAAGAGGPFVLSVSTLEPRKNLGRLLEAHGLARDADPSLPDLVVVGPHGWGGQVRPTEHVHLLGQVPAATLAGLLATCSGFIYVPLDEGFGLPPLEAMAHGAPVITSIATPSMATAPALALVDPLDVAAIADALVVLAAGGDGLQRVRDAGRAHADRHRWVDVAAAHVELWRQLT